LLNGHRFDGHRFDGHRFDGHRFDGHRFDGHRFDGHRLGYPPEGVILKNILFFWVKRIYLKFKSACLMKPNLAARDEWPAFIFGNWRILNKGASGPAIWCGAWRRDSKQASTALTRPSSPPLP